MERAKRSVKYQENGLWGLLADDGTVILSPKYDQIEFCMDFIYVHYGHRHTYFYKKGGSRDCPDDEDDYRFYENGAIGLKNEDGTILFPAIYDEIIDWGNDCDVVYVRKGHEFHYYNHEKNEVLTYVENIPEDKYPECPFNLGEDQNRNVLLCVEPSDTSTGDNVCFAYSQWVKLSRIPRNKVKDIFDLCHIYPMKESALRHFYEEDTYIYSARYCKAKGDYPITNCLEKIKTLGTYDTSWTYLLKICVNNNTVIDNADLFKAICHFEDLESCIDYHIAISYDNSLKDGEVSVFQIHYFWDDMGAFLYNNLYQNIFPKGDFDTVIDAVNSSDNRSCILDHTYWWITYDESRSWDETEKILNWLDSQGANHKYDLLKRNIEINPCYVDDISNDEWPFRKKIVTWAIQHGAQLNRIKEGKTLYEKLMEEIKDAKENDGTKEFTDSITRAEEFLKFLAGIGAEGAKEQRKKVAFRIPKMSLKQLIDESI